MEDIAPLGFYSLMVEPLVLSRIFNKLFEFLDPESYQQMKEIPSMVFVRFFLSLFSELKNVEIRLAIMDLLLCLGSGSMTTTLTSPEVVSIERIEKDLVGVTD